MAQQSQNTVANQVDGSLMTRKEQQGAHVEQLEFGQPVARRLGRDQPCHEIGLWAFAPLSD
jgi:hypothetical protein